MPTGCAVPLTLLLYVLYIYIYMYTGTRLVNDIAKLPEGTIVLAAIADEGVMGITADAVNALALIGSQYIRTIAKRESWVSDVTTLRCSLTREHRWGAADSIMESTAPHQCPLESVASYLCYGMYADVRTFR